jgi:GntR family transcriptional regulator
VVASFSDASVIMLKRIKKDHFEPAYAQLAAILRREIAEGVYPPGEKIPSESIISKEYGISLMTVRQAIGLLTVEGLLERVQGTGTFVKALELTESRFDLGSLRKIFKDPERTQVKILQLCLVRADEETASSLALPSGARVILLRRLLLRDERPIIFHSGYIRYEPTRPVVEAELNLGPFCDFFNGYGGGTAKKGELSLVPELLNEEESGLLGRPVGAPVFRIEYVVYDFDDAPFGCGWFTVLPESMKMKARLGLWQ